MCGTSHVAQERAFMASLMADLDGSMFDEGPTPPQRSALSSIREKSPATGRRVSSSGAFVRRSRASDGSVTQDENKNSQQSAAAKLSPPDATRKRSGSWARRTPSPRKRGILSEKQARVYDEEVQAAAKVFMDESSSWLSPALSKSLSPLTPSPERQKMRRSAKSPASSPLEARTSCSRKATCAKASTCQGPAPLTRRGTDSTDKYVRCLVTEVQSSHYIPRHYTETSITKYMTSGVAAETIEKAMRRRQVILKMKKLQRVTAEGTKGRTEEEADEEHIAILRDAWADTRVQEGDIVHLIGTWNRPDISSTGPKHVKIEVEENTCIPISPHELPTMILSSDTTPVLSNRRAECENILILHPDLLLSATAVSSVTGCTRKPYLQAKVKASGPGEEEKPSEVLVMGRMLHEVLQSCLTGEPVRVEGDFNASSACDIKPSSNDASGGDDTGFPMFWKGSKPTNFARTYVRQQVERQIRRSVEDLLQVGLGDKEAKEKLWEAVQPFASFALTYLAQEDNGSIVQRGEASNSSSSQSPLVQIVKVHDVEEDIWSPMYGLKGFVDVTVEAQISEHGHRKSISNNQLVPLELKTGRSIDIAQHRAQTMLYTLMMSDRYKRSIDAGLLYYSKTAQLHLVKRGQKEVDALLMARNDLASYLFRRKPSGNTEESLTAPIPPTIDDERTCRRCYVKDACMLYRKAIERVSDEADTDDATAIASLYGSKTDHLSQKHLNFFRHWESLLSFEETDVVRYRREMWTMTAEARERNGRCYAGMKLKLDDLRRDQDLPSMTGMLHCHVYELEREDGSKGSLLGGNFANGDPICVSLEPDTLSVAQGHLLEINPRWIRIGVDKSLEAIAKRARISRPKFRIDREELLGGMARVRYNLAKLFFSSPLGDERLRRLVVDLQAPTFRENVKIQNNDGVMNQDQSQAVEKALAANDYALMIGMPGTGKTTTIASLIAHLTRSGKSVLLASYTHSAVDTICRKLLNTPGVDLLRLGSSDRIHIDVRSKMLQPSSSVEELSAKLSRPSVVATTCLSINHGLFALRKSFDFCVIDEASQITMPVCLGPLRYASKFVLVGDPQQLPPLVRDERARVGGLDISLFEMLQRAHPQSVAYLCQQYRMNADIMALSNGLVYEGRLVCGNEAIQRSSLEIDDVNRLLQAFHTNSPTPCQLGTNCFISRVLDPETRALFVDTDEIDAHEERFGNLIQNGKEADIAIQLCSTLMRAGVSAQDVALLTPYRQQIRYITGLLEIVSTSDAHPSLKTMSTVEVLTADKAQGRDKDVIIVSFVRSKDNGGAIVSTSSSDEEHGRPQDGESVGQLLLDVRRINVMLTRARKKLIIVGSSSTLTRAPQLAKLWNLMSERDWTWTLSANDLTSHWCPDLHAPSTLPHTNVDDSGYSSS